MQIAVGSTEQTPTISLIEPDDFKAFKIVVADGTSADVLDAALAQIGSRDDATHAYVSLDAINGLAGDRAQDTAWQTSLYGMIGYARSQGWINGAGDIRAHIDES
jgi:hypothetical protein